MERMVVFAACEYDAWVTMSLLSGVSVDLEGLFRDASG